MRPTRAISVVLMAVVVAFPTTTNGQAPITPPQANTQSAADSALEARTTAVASKLRCPVCQGESIQDSPASLAREMRGVVKEKLRAGESPAQIEAYFVARYGEWILLEPTKKGLNILLYVLPFVLVVGGVALVVVLVRKWSAAPAQGADLS